eukprot:g15959.t1
MQPFENLDADLFSDMMELPALYRLSRTGSVSYSAPNASTLLSMDGSSTQQDPVSQQGKGDAAKFHAKKVLRVVDGDDCAEIVVETADAERLNTAKILRLLFEADLLVCHGHGPEFAGAPPKKPVPAYCRKIEDLPVRKHLGPPVLETSSQTPPRSEGQLQVGSLPELEPDISR